MEQADSGVAGQTVQLHDPARGEGESQQAYRERQAKARKAVRSITGVGLGGGTSSRAQFRDSMRKSGTMGKRVRAADALEAAWASKRIPNWKGPRDEHGALTLIGKPYELEGVHPTSLEVVLEGWVDGEAFGYKVQRKWLAGVSAQRGF
jgi:hypothetical protein